MTSTTSQPPPYVLHVSQDRSTGRYQVVPHVRIHGVDGPAISTNPEPIPYREPRSHSDGHRWIPWGTSDNLPSVIRKKISDVPMAGEAINKLVKLMYGSGLCYYRNADRLANPTEVTRAYEPVVEQFIQRNRLLLYWLVPQFYSYRYAANTFSELIFSRDYSQITGLYHLDSEFSRKSRQDPTTYRSEHLFFSADFAERLNPPYDRITAIPLIDIRDPEWIDRFTRDRTGYKAAWHSYLWTPGSIHYATPPWIGLFKDAGWLDASAAVPEVINAMMRNQIILKYQILIPETYFRTRYADWMTYDSETKIKIMDDTADYIEKNLADTKNAFKSITSFFQHDAAGNAVGKIEIISINDHVKNDSWVPSANAADAQIVQGLGLHPGLVGLAPEGGKMGAGSGSDQREAFNTATDLNTLEQEIVLDVLQFIAQYNARRDPRWDVTFFMDHRAHTTINFQESGVAPSPTTLQIN